MLQITAGEIHRPTCDVWLRQNDDVQTDSDWPADLFQCEALALYSLATTTANASWSCRYLTQLTDLTYHAISPSLPESIYSWEPVNETNKNRRITHLGCGFNKAGFLIILSFVCTWSSKRQAVRFWNACMILVISPAAGFVWLADHREWLTRVYLFASEIWSNIMVSFRRQACAPYKPPAWHDCFSMRLKGSITFSIKENSAEIIQLDKFQVKPSCKSLHKLQDTHSFSQSFKHVSWSCTVAQFLKTLNTNWKTSTLLATNLLQNQTLHSTSCSFFFAPQQYTQLWISHSIMW